MTLSSSPSSSRPPPRRHSTTTLLILIIITISFADGRPLAEEEEEKRWAWLRFCVSRVADDCRQVLHDSSLVSFIFIGFMLSCFHAFMISCFHVFISFMLSCFHAFMLSCFALSFRSQLQRRPSRSHQRLQSERRQWYLMISFSFTGMFTSQSTKLDRWGKH